MGSFTVWVLGALAAACVVFGVVAALTGRASVMSPAPPDRRPNILPPDRAASPDDLRRLRFDLAFRGYRMDEVDAALEQLVVELALRDEEIDSLRRRLERRVGRD